MSKIDVIWNEETLEVEGTFNPGYPAPICSDPDHPNFSDPGEPSCFEIDKIMWDGKDVTELLSDDVGEEIEQLCIDVCIADSQEQEDDRYDTTRERDEDRND